MGAQEPRQGRANEFQNHEFAVVGVVKIPARRNRVVTLNQDTRGDDVAVSFEPMIRRSMSALLLARSSNAA